MQASGNGIVTDGQGAANVYMGWTEQGCWLRDEHKELNKPANRHCISVNSGRWSKDYVGRKLEASTLLESKDVHVCLIII